MQVQGRCGQESCFRDFLAWVSGLGFPVDGRRWSEHLCLDNEQGKPTFGLALLFSYCTERGLNVN